MTFHVVHQKFAVWKHICLKQTTFFLPVNVSKIFFLTNNLFVSVSISSQFEHCPTWGSGMSSHYQEECRDGFSTTRSKVTWRQLYLEGKTKSQRTLSSGSINISQKCYQNACLTSHIKLMFPGACPFVSIPTVHK